MARADLAATTAHVEAYLDRALAAAQAAAWSQAADHLIEAWRARPSTRVCDLIAAIDSHVPVRPIVGRTVAEREQRWLEVARSADEAGLRCLFATPWPTHPKAARTRIKALALRKPSPRIGWGLLEVHERRQYQTSSGPMVSRDILRLLLSQGDPLVTRYFLRIEPELDALDVTLRITVQPLLERKRPIDPTPSVREAEIIDALVALIPLASELGPRRAALLDEIYAAPFDDGPRAVLADVLIEHDDPRGELITLQLRRAKDGDSARVSSRERALLREAGNLWFDGLDKLGATAVELARGFPVTAMASHGDFTAPEWATIEVLRLDRDTPPLHNSLNLRALRQLYGLPAAHLGNLALADPALDVLVLRGIDGLDATTSIAPRCLGFAGLPFDATRMLGEIRAQIAKLVHAPFGRRVEELLLAVRIDQLPFAFTILADTPRLRSVTLTGDYDAFAYDHLLWSAQITRSSLHVTWHSARHASRRNLDTLAQTLRALEMLPVETVEIVEMDPLAPKVRDRVREELVTALSPWSVTATILET